MKFVLEKLAISTSFRKQNTFRFYVVGYFFRDVSFLYAFTSVGFSSLCFSMVFAAACQFLLHNCFTVYFYRRGEFAKNSCGDISRRIRHRQSILNIKVRIIPRLYFFNFSSARVVRHTVITPELDSFEFLTTNRFANISKNCSVYVCRI